jgi:hypothetical protein
MTSDFGRAVFSQVDGIDYTTEQAMRLLFPEEAPKMYDAGKQNADPDKWLSS